MPTQPNAFDASAAPHRDPDPQRREDSSPDSPRRPEDLPDQKPTKQNQTAHEKPHINAPAENPAWSHRVGENPEEAGQEEREHKSTESAGKKIENEPYRDDKRR
ncbi:MAG: hypothetical protein ACRD4S_13845 [Candidatus Acidiferrales bacterium]